MKEIAKCIRLYSRLSSLLLKVHVGIGKPSRLQPDDVLSKHRRQPVARRSTGIGRCLDCAFRLLLCRTRKRDNECGRSGSVSQLRPANLTGSELPGEDDRRGGDEHCGDRER